ncbi:CaiB/BaiF CoA-transferase family protein [Poseidonocella sp. HB161398]|uniref:CaiB/BaiF CoA transferase family protein n=1 Tax=Poseidonocella sp. HB161398 TaxID=2320855 RepID=UPI001107D39C|nr:CaiB/BaiF CoA-transferase family protein [Poseidonocella sp. HB161398]
MQNNRPLKGIRVLDLGSFIAGPYAAEILAMLGAEVVKVEPTHGGDPFRRGEGTGSPYFVQANAGKKSLAVNLKAPEGCALVKSLLPRFDVFIENSRPGVMERLGLGPEAVRAINPSIVYASASGFGDGGPWRDRAAYDTIGLSMSGFLSLMSDENRNQLAGTCIGDLTTGLVCALGIASALVGRELDPARGGSELKTSLLEAMSTMTVDALTQMFETGERPHRESRHPAANSFCVRTSDGSWMTVHLSSPQKFWIAFLAAMDNPEFGEDPRFATYPDRRAHYFALRPLVEAEFLRHDRAEWERRLVAADVPFAPVVTIDALPGNEQMQWLDMFEPARPDGQRLLRAPWRINGERPGKPDDAPDIGAHTREIAMEVLDAQTIEALVARGVLAQA